MSGGLTRNPDTGKDLTEGCTCALNGVEIYTFQNVDLLTQHKWSSKQLSIVLNILTFYEVMLYGLIATGVRLFCYTLYQLGGGVCVNIRIL